MDTMCEGAPTEDHLGTAFALALPWAQKKGWKIADVPVICHILVHLTYKYLNLSVQVYLSLSIAIQVYPGQWFFDPSQTHARHHGQSSLLYG